MKPTNKLMKRLSIYLFLILVTLQTPSQADDIRDFQIEGMSIGDSLLTYISEELITTELGLEYTVWYHNNEFASVSLWEIREKFELYDDVGVVIKPTDKKYKIYSLEGTLYFNQDIERCYEEQKQRVVEFKELFGNQVILDSWVAKNPPAKHLKKVKHEDFEFDSGDELRIICYDTHEDYERRKDSMYITINSKEFSQFLNKYHTSN